MNQQQREYQGRADVPARDDIPAITLDELAELLGRIAELRVQLRLAQAETERMRQERDQFYQLAMLQGVVV